MDLCTAESSSDALSWAGRPGQPAGSENGHYNHINRIEMRIVTWPILFLQIGFVNLHWERINPNFKTVPRAQ